MKKLLFFLTLSILAEMAFAQTEKCPLTFDDILSWNRFKLEPNNGNPHFKQWKLYRLQRGAVEG